MAAQWVGGAAHGVSSVAHGAGGTVHGVGRAARSVMRSEHLRSPRSGKRIDQRSAIAPGARRRASQPPDTDTSRRAAPGGARPAGPTSAAAASPAASWAARPGAAPVAALWAAPRQCPDNLAWDGGGASKVGLEGSRRLRGECHEGADQFDPRALGKLRGAGPTTRRRIPGTHETPVRAAAVTRCERRAEYGSWRGDGNPTRDETTQALDDMSVRDISVALPPTPTDLGWDASTQQLEGHFMLRAAAWMLVVGSGATRDEPGIGRWRERSQWHFYSVSKGLRCR